MFLQLFPSLVLGEIVRWVGSCEALEIHEENLLDSVLGSLYGTIALVEAPCGAIE